MNERISNIDDFIFESEQTELSDAIKKKIPNLQDKKLQAAVNLYQTLKKSPNGLKKS